MTTSQSLEKQSGGVPDLVRTPALEIEAEDIALPRLYLGQYMSAHVQEDRVEPGSIFTALGSDDLEPNVLWEPGQEGGVVFHVLAMRKGKSITVDGELELYDYNDPEAPPEAWVTYNYVIALPEVDEDVPYKWLLTRTGRPAAQQVNMVLKKTAALGPAHTQAFEAFTAPRENPKGKFFVPRVRSTEALDKNVQTAASLTAIIAGQPDEPVDRPSTEPAI